MGKLVDLTGQVFGQLTVIERVKFPGEHESHWKCMCTCGNDIIAIAGNLKRGQTQSCGCTAYDRGAAERIIDIAGQKFGMLTALYITKRKSKEDTLWHCKCDCGNECDVSVKNLRSGHTKSCGCFRKEVASENFTKDLTGQTFGYLTVVEKVGKKNSYILWGCKCKCGNYIEVASGDLLSGHTTSCGCRRSSYGEEQIRQILDNENIQYLYNRGYFKDLVGEDRLPLRYDFILMNSSNIPYRLIEFDGPQHDKPFSFFGGEQKFLKQKENDHKKDKYAKAHNIPLVRIPYSKRNNIFLEDLLGDKYLINGGN